MATIRDVAKLANVSTASVSRVLNNDSKYKMTEETKLRVLEAVNQLGYKLPTSTIKQSATPTLDGKIGCVLRQNRKTYNDPYFMSILSAAEDKLRENGYEITFIRTGPDADNLANLLDNLQVPLSGLLLMDELDEEDFRLLHKKVPHIVGISSPRTDIDNIDYDRLGISCFATEHLIAAGHTNIGFIGGGGHCKDITTSVRYRGYQTAMHCAKLPINEMWVLDCEWDEDLCAQKIDELCKTDNYPSAFFVSSDLMAIAAMNSFYSNQIRVPEDVAIISVTDIDVAKYTNPPLTTFHIPTEEMGIVAAEMLLKRINGYALLPQKIILPCEMIKRGTA